MNVKLLYVKKNVRKILNVGVQQHLKKYQSPIVSDLKKVFFIIIFSVKTKSIWCQYIKNETIWINDFKQKAKRLYDSDRSSTKNSLGD